ncbi:MAG: wax ester/triacylglycerol synthase family O-acyltransferase [Deltaproteobacteria bacterium]|nr:wax ester/triacylglycerol synthase family O-acyltransferase [Deltaproteobacteria bacterium]MBW2361777.1 wax ester/triacylglycerol synthase family O-acyltransferase [Deltaproteobacteria bacterium]
MAYVHYERLRSVDAAMLAVEDANTHMHVGAVALFDAAPLTSPDGALQIDRIRASMAAAMLRTPRFRQKLVPIPVFEHPVWVDDPRFNLEYHVRHTALPQPGGVRRLKRLVGRLMSQKLDPTKPLWEVWVVEGIEEGRFALVIKAHHCMIDGVGGINVFAALMSPDPEAVPPQETERWIPRPAPSSSALLSDEIRRRASVPLSLAKVGWQALREPRDSAEALRHGASAAWDALTAAGGMASPTPLDDETGPYRRVDWLTVDLGAALDAKRALGGTLNDLVLACSAGAFGRFLKKRGVRIEDLDFRASVPVNTRQGQVDHELGNHISSLFAPLPIDEPDPIKRLAKVVETTRELKRSTSKGGWGALDDFSDRVFPSLMGHMMKLMTTRLRLINVYVSNIPGPRVPIYLQGARMLEIYPIAPVVHVIGVALFSYDKSLHWAFNADWDKFPDLHELLVLTEDEFERMIKAAAARPASV